MSRLYTSGKYFLAICLFAALPISSEPLRAEDKPRIISLSAEGIVKAKPDIATISTGVQTEAKEAREALDSNNAAMKRVILELKEQGIEAKDIQTSNFSVQPKYRHFKDGRSPEITGYAVSNSVQIIVRDLTRLGEVLDKVVTFGSNQIGGISFSISDRDELLDEARKSAVKDVRKKAELYAEAAGVKLGDILKFSEQSSRVSSGPVLRGAMSMAKAEAVPIEAGQQAVQVRVNVVWELE